MFVCLYEAHVRIRTTWHIRMHSTPLLSGIRIDISGMYHYLLWVVHLISTCLNSFWLDGAVFKSTVYVSIILHLNRTAYCLPFWTVRDAKISGKYASDLCQSPLNTLVCAAYCAYRRTFASRLYCASLDSPFLKQKLSTLTFETLLWGPKWATPRWPFLMV